MMRATVQSGHLAAAMKHSIAARTGVMEWSQHALVTTTDAGLSISTSDGSAYCEVTIPAQVDTTGVTLVEAARLGRMSGVGQEIRLDESTGRELRARCGRNLLRAPTLPPGEWPQRDPDEWKEVAFNPVALRAAMAAVIYAAGRIDARHWINAVHVRRGAVEASNGLVIATAPMEGYEGPNLLIPSDRAVDLLRLLDTGSTVQVSMSREPSASDARAVRVAQCDAGAAGVAVALSTPLVAMTYPDIAGYCARADEAPRLVEMSVDRAELQMAVRALLPFVHAHAAKRDPIAGITVTDQGVMLRAADGSEFELPAAQVSASTGDLHRGIRIDHLDKALDTGTSERLVVQFLEQSNKAWRLSDGTSTHIMTEVLL